MMQALYRLRYSSLVLGPSQKGWSFDHRAMFGEVIGAAWRAPICSWSDREGRALSEVPTYPDLAWVDSRYLIMSNKAQGALACLLSRDTWEALPIVVEEGPSDYLLLNCTVRVGAGRIDPERVLFRREMFEDTPKYFERLALRGGDALPAGFYVDQWKWNGMFFTEEFREAVRNAGLTGFTFLVVGEWNHTEQLPPR